MDSMDVEANLPSRPPYFVNGFLRQWEGCCTGRRIEKSGWGPSMTLLEHVD